MSARKPLITIIGSLNIDYVTTTSRCPGPGETLTATSLSISAGGKGANQAVGCGKAAFVAPGQQDVDVELVGAVGQGDVYVKTLLMPTLQESGVGINGIKEIKGGQTGTATIVVESDSGQNRIMVVPGANHDEMNNLDDILARSTKDGRQPDVVVMQGEIPRDIVLGLLKHFNSGDFKTQVILNPAPVFPDGIPPETLKGLSTLVVNEGETILLGRSLKSVGFVMDGIESEDDLQNPSNLAQICQQFHDLLGISTVLITLGAKGSYYSSLEKSDMGLVPGVTVAKVVDTTAAGDTFVGYFAAALARRNVEGDRRDFDIEAAVARANEAAAKCVSKAGAMQSIPYGFE